MVVARGWGHAVFYVCVGWLLVLILWALLSGIYEPDIHKVNAILYRLGAVWFLLSAFTLHFIVRYRAKMPRPGGETGSPIVQEAPRDDDDFNFIRLHYWPAILFALGLGCLIASFFT